MRCGAMTKSGEQCPARAAEGMNLCSFHSLIMARSKTPRSTRKTREQRTLQLEAGVERILYEEARKFCVCRSLTVWNANAPEEFEAAMNVPCPIHGQRRLGAKIIIGSIPKRASDLRMSELLREYSRRLLVEEESNFDSANNK